MDSNHSSDITSSFSDLSTNQSRIRVLVCVVKNGTEVNETKKEIAAELGINASQLHDT